VPQSARFVKPAQ